ncbi:glycosyltransferase family 2 protein [Bdellovibrio sp. SKB1291214]|uniref:glycosyltransferase family 2 protein n=1 Tax=Bdellovibrio sp. SKB1291214 TaxID=1732569 RepID=UPI000B51DA6D|nr:glycosyltransferase family 2 protein [Bdellovibrio sp. SKB1291214]UYL09544.1 glycosyltransferase family 2 protein [Bdellovibrio sp. SKB1291214]
MQQNPVSILLVIVNYNQELEINSFLCEVMKFWPLKDAVLVDDGSTDRSTEIARNSGFEVIAHPYNQGVGAAIRSGIHHAQKNKYDAVLIMSSNGKMLPSEIASICDPVKMNEADYATGSRFLAGGNSPGLSNFRRISIPIFSAICTFLLGRKFSDITCGFRCYRIDFLFNGTCDINQEWLSRYELEYYIHYWACRTGLCIKEVPVTIRYSHLNEKRKSKIRPIVDWWSMIKPLLFLRLKLKK